MSRDRQGFGDEQWGKVFAVGSLRQVASVKASLRKRFSRPWTERTGSVTIGYHHQMDVRQVFAEDGETIDPENDRTWASEKEIYRWSDENKIPW